MSLARIAIAGFALASGYWLAQSPTKQTSTPPPPSPKRVEIRRMGPFHGMAIQAASAYQPVERYGKLITEIAELGADTVIISVDVYQKHAGSRQVEIDEERIPSWDDMLALFALAKQQGLRVMLMPKVLLSDPRGNEWRGVIQPNDWQGWFASYTDVMKYMAKLASAGRIEVLMVGSELVSTEKHTERWADIIAAMRQIYGGMLGYSANWDHYKNIAFWDQLDLVGLTTYYKLADEPNPPIDTLVSAWGPIKEGLLDWQAQINRPLVFTEVGWCSQEGAAEFPWNYYHHQKATPAGHEEQRRLYAAFMQVWQNVPQVGGIIWWEWTESAGGGDDFNYTPRGKPAEQELRNWFSAQQRKARNKAASRPGVELQSKPTSKK